MNASLLLAKIKEEGMSVSGFLRSIHMSPATWSKKIQGNSEFNRDEMQRIIAKLKLQDADITIIFFSSKVY